MDLVLLSSFEKYEIVVYIFFQNNLENLVLQNKDNLPNYRVCNIFSCHVFHGTYHVINNSFNTTDLKLSEQTV